MRGLKFLPVFAVGAAVLVFGECSWIAAAQAERALPRDSERTLMREDRESMRGKRRNRPVTVKVNKRRLMVGSQEVPLLAGEVHYWRLERKYWPAILQAVKECGLTTVSTYVPWRVHEAERGRFDFGEAGGSSLDLAAFLKLCQELGLYVFLRPGPLIVSEMPLGGLPDWLFADSSILTRNHRGEVAAFGFFAAKGSPCYLHPEYLEHVRRWLTKVNEIARPYFASRGGPVILVQLDNEISMICLDSYLVSDYNDAVVREGGLYHQWLERKYKTIDNVPYRDKPAAITAVQPPRELPDEIADDLFYYFDWAEFKEDLMADYVAALRDIHRGDGLTRELFVVNFNPHRPIDTPNNWHKLEQATGGGISGFDYYKRPHMTFEGFQKTALSARYSCAVTRLPWSPEWMCGIWGEDFGGDGVVGPEHTEFLYLVGLAYGLVGFNHYMFAEREEWSFSAVSPHGRRRYNFYALQTMTRIHKELDPPSLTIDSRVGLLFYRPYAWLAYIEDSFAARDDQVQLGKRKVDATVNGESAREFEGLFSLLLQLGHVPTILSPEADPNFGFGLKAIVVPCQERMAPDVLRRLYSLARKGTRIVFDPAPPTLDWDAKPLDLLPPPRADIVSTGVRFAQRAAEEEARLFANGFVTPFGVESQEQLDTLARALGNLAPAVSSGDRFVPVVLATRGKERFLFVLNLHPRSKEIEIEVPAGARALRDLKTQERITVQDGKAAFPVDCKQGRILRILD